MAAQRVTIHPDEVIHETVDGEVILIALQTGWYYSLEGSGAEIWEGLVAGRSSAELVTELEARYRAGPGEIRQAVFDLVARLMDEGLAQAVDSEGAAQPASPFQANGDRPTFTPPVLHKFTDMQDFLLVDPVHEVADAGWPHQPPAA
jgi:hypothetical protein